MDENSLVLQLKKPFTFEGKEYTSVDLSKMEEWTGDDVVNIRNKFVKLASADVTAMDSILPESNLRYCQFVAAEASGLPLDFFRRLPARECGALQALVIGFFHGTV